MTPPSSDGQELSSLPFDVDWLEVRSDLVGDLDADWLRDRFKGRLLYSLRSRAEGGKFEVSPGQRGERLGRAARTYDLVELEGDCDLAPELLAGIPAEKRLVSWHGPAADLPELKARFAQLSAVPAALYKLVTRATKYVDELAPLALLNSLGRADTVAYAEGALGFWSRMVAPHLGAPVIFGSVPNGPATPAEPAINKLIEDYGLPTLRKPEAIYGIAGSPVFHSLSPRLHNAAYRAVNYPALFVPFHVESFDEFWHEVVGADILSALSMPIKGLTVASPHKEVILSHAGTASLTARRAESANIVVQADGSWRADTTDPEVVFMAQHKRRVQVSERRAAVIGCGGAGRAIAAALAQSGAEVTLVNRSAGRGHYSSQLLSLPYTTLSEFSAAGYNIIVNATPVGRDDGAVPFRLETLGEDVTLIDLVYGSAPSPLMAHARTFGLTAIDGREVLLTQVRRQFQMMTGAEMPATLLRQKPGLAVAPLELSVT